MKVLITGATGFLGSYIVDRFIHHNDNVRVLVRPTSDTAYLKRYENIEYVFGSITDKTVLEKATRDVDVVCHAAARVSYQGRRKLFFEENYIASQNLVDMCRKNKVKRLVFISTPGVVFDYTHQINIDERYPYPDGHDNLYCETKSLAEQYVLKENNPNGLTTVVLRPHAIWGPRDRNGFFPRLAVKASQGKLARIVGKEEPVIQLCFAQNAADACLLSATSEKAAGNIYFITDGETLKIWDIVDRVCRKLNLPVPEKTVDAKVAFFIGWAMDLLWKIPYLADNYEQPISRHSVGLLTYSTTYNNSASYRDLGYQPRINFETGLDMLKQWIDESGGIQTIYKK